jgi:hypothetical protein
LPVRDDNRKKGNVFEYLEGSKRQRLKRNKKAKVDEMEDVKNIFK